MEHAAAATGLWLVRHGQTTWNALGLVQGQTDLPRLTARGRQEARCCAEMVRGQPIGAVHSSDLRRALTTAWPVALALGLPVLEDRRLRERALGVAEGTPAVLLGAERLGVAGDRVVDADAAPSGGESIRQLYRRVAGFAAELLDRRAEGDVVVVCHGGVVRVLRAWLDGVGPDDMTWGPVGNGTVVHRSLRAPAVVG